MKPIDSFHVWTTAVAIALTTGALAVAQQASPSKPAHLMVTPGELKWVDAPASLPPGAKAVLLEGDMSKAELFTLRIQLPANYGISAH